MNAAPVELPGWTRGRFWGVAGVFFAAQAALILLFSEGDRGQSPAAPGSVHFRLMGAPLTADQLTETFFAIDPTVFPRPGLHGFSESAWLKLPDQQFEVPGELEPPAWLQLDTARLGTNFPLSHRADSPMPFAPMDQNGAGLEPWPVSLAQGQVRIQSSFEIQGELAARKLNAPAELPAWPSTQLLSNSVVQIAVNAAGQVVATRLLGRSGSAEADASALGTSRGLRFRPVPVSAPVWGNAVFEWQTVEQTNAVPATAPVLK
jgi:hypothetical protein